MSTPYVIFLFRCVRCCAAFILESRDETRGGQSQWDYLQGNPCKVCGKGDVQFVGHLDGWR